MVQGGEGMARLPDGRVCFVQGGLPGELCKVELLQNKKDFTRGRVVKVLEKCTDRAEPKCPLFGKCGGCSLQHLASEKQASYLEQVERENFRRLAHADLPDDFKIHVGPAWGYRNRARVVIASKKDGKIVYGFRMQKSNGMIPFANCPVLTPALNAFLKENASKIFEESMKVSKRPPRNFELDVNLFDNGKGDISYFYKGMPAQDFEKSAISVVEIAGSQIRSDASVFFQSNLSLLPELVQSVQEAVDAGIASGEASDVWLIDLFSGVGFFAAILKDKFKKITTVEREEGCLKHAKVNLNGADNVSAPAEEWLVKNVVDVPATLIVDPPRTGLPVEALDAIVKSSVNRLIYVSCDPVTLARDYAKFAQAGFSLKKAEGFAFYPQTPHLEMMFILSR
ncbi:23S rRNA (uracil1939-C5)-methyltransferase [Fibrobacter sp. UWB15]|jgi:23S rRNA (uracil1939-C5)-methyltransferase|nr:23S rRNA (uracil1939-C5)-methyltransferase [Fibrobacter sp. UWB6]SHF61321.1 23S rRNA (uracil1939-C5)-methyltransferase [Fibrobacter sp. UWB8]SMG07904.1 23S rRNA (uracil1939-C5)-methyltransferase [Fibrobacter sp. UWB15]